MLTVYYFFFWGGSDSGPTGEPSAGILVFDADGPTAPQGMTGILEEIE